MSKPTKAPEKAPEQRKLSLASVVIALTMVVFACICGVLLGLFAPALGNSFNGMRLSAQKRYTEAASAYNKVSTELSTAQEKLSSILQPENLRGVEYRELWAYSRISPLQCGSLLTSEYTAEQMEEFPYRKLKDYYDGYNVWSQAMTTFDTAMSPYVNEEQTAYENIDRDEIFQYLDSCASTMPSWAMAVFKNYISAMVGDSAELRLTYFDEAIKSNDGIDEYAYSIVPIYVELEKWDELAALYERKIKINRNDSDAFLGLGKVAIVRGEDKELAKVLKRAEKYVGKSGVPQSLRIEQLRRLEQYDDATKIYVDYSTEQEKLGSGSFYEAMRQYAIVLLLQGDYASAHEYAYSAAVNQPENGGDYSDAAYYLVCLTAELSGDTEMIEQYGLEVNAAGRAIVDAADKQAAIKAQFLSGRGDIV
ncbi:MAG: hypothetical protein LBQ80_02500 [Clostridium sp.]|jgi:hypothetical protein|nr:hypothetical protein [Clostridium sp.]